MSTRLRNEKNAVLNRWIFTEAQTGKTRLDTHYSFLNEKFKAYVEDDNGILIEDDIVKAISFNGGIDGTTTVLVDSATIFGKRDFKEINFKIKTGEQETHDVCWLEDYLHVTKSSNVSDT